MLRSRNDYNRSKTSFGLLYKYLITFYIKDEVYLGVDNASACDYFADILIIEYCHKVIINRPLARASLWSLLWKRICASGTKLDDWMYKYCF